MTTTRTTNETRRRVMKMAHVRRRVDAQIFGKVESFAAYLRGAWATVKAEQAKAAEEARTAEMRRALVLPTTESARVSFEAGLQSYYGARGRYYGD